jgi:2,4-dienoyl-CoA reductase-like NADH-dependent reductase (Old Yellow Enzyme family)
MSIPRLPSSRLPIIVAGGLGNVQDAVQDALGVLANGEADVEAVGTAMLKYPAWACHVKEVPAVLPTA